MPTRSASRSLGTPAVIWLDGHYSGWLTACGETDTPCGARSRPPSTRGAQDDVLLIDDARLFGVHPAYPSVEDIAALVRSRRLGWALRLEDDILRVSAD